MNLTPLMLRTRVAIAAQTITSTWPLDSFIAVNPLSRYEHLRFGEGPGLPAGTRFTRSGQEYLTAHHDGDIPVQALRQALAELVPEIAGSPDITINGRTKTALDVAVEDLLEPLPTPEHADTSSHEEQTMPSVVDELTAGWLARLLGSPDWNTRQDGESFYPAFHRLATRDWSLPAASRRRLAALPPTPEGALLHVLESRNIDESTIDSTLRNQLNALPGWVSHIVHRAQTEEGTTVLDYLATRVALHHALNQPFPPTATTTPVKERDFRRDAETLSKRLFAGSPTGQGPLSRLLMFLTPTLRPLIWQKAAEIHYRATLIHALDAPDSPTTPPKAQFVFCIDTRSEGMRRHLEGDPLVSTFGFAGFFGVPLHFDALHATASREHYPALLSGGIPSTEKPTNEQHAEVRRRRLVASSLADESSAQASHTPAAAFSWAEAAGWFHGIAAAARTLTPNLTHRIDQALTKHTSPDTATHISLPDTFDIEKQANLAEAALRMMGLTTFADLVVLTGHRSTTHNNLFQSALDCGACGGNAGAPNARAAALIFNNADVRTVLAGRGLSIPASTRFVAAEHDTTTDTLTILDPHLIPPHHHTLLHQLAPTITAASDALTQERAEALPGASPKGKTRTIRGRAHDWAEMFPELGLAGNAALLIGPRHISRGCDLKRRVFLHSYDADTDTDGQALEAIMTAPLLVAQWINHQYYFSTLNPDTLGAGNKTLHNPIHNLGTLAGHGGDLRTGLPWQSVAIGEHLLHTPLRLSVFIQAPLHRVNRIIDTTDALRNLLNNDWITLHARPHADAPWRQHTPYGFTRTRRNPS